MMLRCEVCMATATHVCGGLDEPAVYFCERHGKAHEAAACCEGGLVKMGEPATPSPVPRCRRQNKQV